MFKLNQIFGTDLEKGQVLVLQSVGNLQVLQDHRAVGVHPHHAVIVILTIAQLGQLVTHPLTNC